jgi:hypothetical protein
MKWPWLQPSPQDVAAIAFGIVLAAAVIFALVIFPNFRKHSANFGFGPDWDCTTIPKAGPVCVKQVGIGPGNQNLLPK